MPPNKKDNFNQLVAQKTQKIVAAVYLVSEMIPEADPIRISIKEESLALLKTIESLNQSDTKDNISVYTKSSVKVAHLVSLVHIAKLAGSVSVMNAELLLEGLTSLHTVLEKKRVSTLKKISSESLLVSFDDAFDTTLPPAVTAHQEEVDGVRKSVVAVGGTVPETQQQAFSHVKVNEAYIAHTAKGESKDGVRKSMGTGVFKARKTSRRDQILSLFVRGEDMSIKDISTKVRGCSEKTIQRELNTLVFENIIERIGEKRWSRYALR